VLGFSKGANQIKAANAGDFDKVGFARMRTRLATVLETLGLITANADIDHLLSAQSKDLGAASLLRCGLSLEKEGKLETSGPIVAMSLQDSWTRERISTCVRSHLVQMPSSISHVVLLGNDDRYVAGVKEVMKTAFQDYSEVNPMAFRARGATWVFAVHPSPANGHFASWQPGGTGKQAAKCRAAVAALANTSPVAPVATPAAAPVDGRSHAKSPTKRTEIRTSPLSSAGATPTARKDRYAKTFHLVGAKGENLHPVREARGDGAFILAKRGTNTHHKEFKIRVLDEEQAYQMVASGTYKIRAIREGDKSPSLVGLGDRAVRQVTRTKA
jgi:hypothetical protein